MKGKRYSMVLRNRAGDEREFDVTFSRSASSHDCFAIPVVDAPDRAAWADSHVVRTSQDLTGRVIEARGGIPRLLLDHSLTRYRPPEDGSVDSKDVDSSGRDSDGGDSER